MGHYIASYERDNIVHVHLAMMNIPDHYEFTLNTSKYSLHCMLFKNQLYIDKLRIIELIEDDFNAAMNNMLLSRSLCNMLFMLEQIMHRYTADDTDGVHIMQ